MKLQLYVVRDSLAGSSELVLTAINDEILKRSIKGVLMSKQPNFINSDTKDKDVYNVAVLDTESGIVTGLATPVFVVNVEQLRIELVAEINRRMAEAHVEGGSEDVNETQEKEN